MVRILSLAATVVALFSLTGNAADEKKGTIVETAVGNKDFSTLVTAVKAGGLAEALGGKGPFTVFAPTNAAFAKIPEKDLKAVLADKEKLVAILKAHVVEGKVMSKDVKASKVKTLGGYEVEIKVDGKTVTVGGAKVTAVDIECSNGVIHVIDTVIIPAK